MSRSEEDAPWRLVEFLGLDREGNRERHRRQATLQDQKCDGRIERKRSISNSVPTFLRPTYLPWQVPMGILIAFAAALILSFGLLGGCANPESRQASQKAAGSGRSQGRCQMQREGRTRKHRLGRVPRKLGASPSRRSRAAGTKAARILKDARRRVGLYRALRASPRRAAASG